MSQPTSNDNVIVVPYHSDNGLVSQDELAHTSQRFYAFWAKSFS